MIRLQNYKILVAWVLVFLYCVPMWDALSKKYGINVIDDLLAQYKVRVGVGEWESEELTQRLEHHIRKNFKQSLKDIVTNEVKSFEQKSIKYHSTENEMVLKPWIEANYDNCYKLVNSELYNSSTVIIGDNEAITNPTTRLSKTSQQSKNIYKAGRTKLLFENNNHFSNELPERDNYKKYFSKWGTRQLTCGVFNKFIGHIKSNFIDQSDAYVDKTVTEMMNDVLQIERSSGGFIDNVDTSLIKPQLMYLVVGIDAVADRLLYPSYDNKGKKGASRYPPGERIWWQKIKNMKRYDCRLTKAYGDIFGGNIVRTLACNMGTISDEIGKGSVFHQYATLYRNNVSSDDKREQNTLRIALLIDFIYEKPEAAINESDIDNGSILKQGEASRWYGVSSIYNFDYKLENIIRNIKSNDLLILAFYISILFAFVTTRIVTLSKSKVLKSISYGTNKSSIYTESTNTTIGIVFDYIKNITAKFERATTNSDSFSAPDIIHTDSKASYTFGYVQKRYIHFDYLGFGIDIPYKKVNSHKNIDVAVTGSPDIIIKDPLLDDGCKKTIARHLQFSTYLPKEVFWRRSQESDKLILLEEKRRKEFEHNEYGVKLEYKFGYAECLLKLTDLCKLYRNRNIDVVMGLSDFINIIKYDLNTFLKIASCESIKLSRFILADSKESWDECYSEYANEIIEILNASNNCVYTILFINDVGHEFYCEICSHFVKVDDDYIIEIDGIYDCRERKKGLKTKISSISSNGENTMEIVSVKKDVIIVDADISKYLYSHIRFRKADVDYYGQYLSKLKESAAGSIDMRRYIERL